MGTGTPAGFEKRAEVGGRTTVWVDEPGFYLLPAKVRTYAPHGQTPILRVSLTRDHLSPIGALMPQGRVLLHTEAKGAYGRFHCKRHPVRAFIRHAGYQV